MLHIVYTQIYVKFDVEFGYNRKALIELKFISQVQQKFNTDILSCLVNDCRASLPQRWSYSRFCLLCVYFGNASTTMLETSIRATLCNTIRCMYLGQLIPPLTLWCIGTLSIWLFIVTKWHKTFSYICMIAWRSASPFE